jgi:hypothetical protein
MAKGVMVVNWIFLVIFYLIYFITIPTLQSVMSILQGIFSDFGGNNLWAGIPDSTWFLMNLILYIIVPIGALVWTILASRPQQQQYPYPA